MTRRGTATESYITNLQDKESSGSTICPLGLWLFCLSSFQVSRRALGIHTMGHVSQSLVCPPIDGTFPGRLQLKFPGLLGNLCVSQLVIQGIYLRKIGTRLDLLHEALGKRWVLHPSISSPWTSQGSMRTDAVQVALQCERRLFMYESDQLEWAVTVPIRLWHFCRTGINTAI